jgi:hypothetical protein
LFQFHADSFRRVKSKKRNIQEIIVRCTQAVDICKSTQGHPRGQDVDASILPGETFAAPEVSHNILPTFGSNAAHDNLDTEGGARETAGGLQAAGTSSSSSCCTSARTRRRGPDLLEDRLLTDVAGADRDVDAQRALGKRRDGLRAEVDDGDEDAGDGYNGKGTGAPRAVRLLAQQPYLALPFGGRHLLALDDEALLLLEFTHDGLVELIELEFLDEHVFRYFEGSPKTTAGLVIVEDRLDQRTRIVSLRHVTSPIVKCLEEKTSKSTYSQYYLEYSAFCITRSHNSAYLEGWPMTIDEDLVSSSVPVAAPLDWVA